MHSREHAVEIVYTAAATVKHKEMVLLIPGQGGVIQFIMLQLRKPSEARTLETRNLIVLTHGPAHRHGSGNGKNDNAGLHIAHGRPGRVALG